MNIYKVEYEPIINRFIYISAESEEEALHLASEIMDKTDAIRFDETDITGVITHVIGAVGEDTESVPDEDDWDDEWDEEWDEEPDDDSFPPSNLKGSSLEAEGKDYKIPCLNKQRIVGTIHLVRGAFARLKPRWKGAKQNEKKP